MIHECEKFRIPVVIPPFYHSVALRGVPGDGCPLDFLRPSQISAIEVINRSRNAKARQLSRTTKDRKLRTRESRADPRIFPPRGASKEGHRTVVEISRIGSSMANSRKHHFLETRFRKNPERRGNPRIFYQPTAGSGGGGVLRFTICGRLARFLF